MMKIVIITGASSGLGREFVKQMEHFYAQLNEIWVVGRRKDRLEELARKVSLPVRVFDGDLMRENVYCTLEAVLKEEKPDVRMLVNAAGFGKSGTVEEIAGKDLRVQLDMIETNCKALTHMTLLCLPYFSAGSRILNVASAAAFCPQPSFAVYAATKSYVLSFSRGLGGELRRRNIFVTAVCPGPVETEFFDISGKTDSKVKEAVMAKPGPVVKKALLDSKHKKAMSVYGISMKGTALAAKFIPHGWIVKLCSRQQGEKR